MRRARIHSREKKVNAGTSRRTAGYRALKTRRRKAVRRNMKDFSIAFRYNGWLGLGCLCFPPSCMLLAVSIWYFVASLDDNVAAVHGSCLVEFSIGLVGGSWCHSLQPR
jgi:hypothetical protein